MAWYHRVWNTLRPDRLQSDLQRELRFHVAERVDELRESGMSEAHARRTAQLQFGNLTAQIERTRDMDIPAFLEATLRNLRLALRSLAKTPAFTATVVLTLAIGIGANSAVFSAIDAVLLRPLPFPNGDQLVTVGQVQAKVPQSLVAPIRLEEWNRLNSTLQGITGYYSQDSSELSGELPERLKLDLVAPRFLQVLGISPVLGRDFRPEEEHFGGPTSLLISYRYWQRRFGGSPNAIGKTLRLGSTDWTVVGVMPASFLFPDRDVDLWTPSPPDAPYAQSRESTWYTAVGRLKPGVTLAQALSNLETVQSNLGRQFPKTDSQITARIDPLKETTIGGVRKSLWVVFASVSLLLLIACINIAALLLSRAAGRRQEIAVRFSLGASRASVAAQFLVEVFILALAGSALGLLLAAGASMVFRTLARDLPRLEEIGLNWKIVGYSLTCAVAATFVSGLFPAIRSTRRGLAESMAHAGRSQVSRRNPLQLVLVGVQVAFAVTLLGGAGLLLRSFQELGRVSPGFDPLHVLTFRITTSWGETADFKAGRQRMGQILDGLRSTPGVEGATVAFNLAGVPSDYQVEVKTPDGRAESEPRMMTQVRWVTPDYFATLGIPLLAGEMCRDEGNNTIMVNRTFANLYWNGSAAVGHHIGQPAAPGGIAGVIRGIVGDVRETGMDRPPPAVAYSCGGTTFQPGLYFMVRTHGDPAAMAGTIRRKMHELEPRRSVYDLTPLTDHISDAYAENRLRTILLAFFALTAVSLACIGLYGTLSYLVRLRQREVALRLALGALRVQVVRQFLGVGLRVTLLGCAAGLALAWFCARLLTGLLFGVSPTDTATAGGVVAIVLGVALVASLIPAVRAARMEPMQALREE